jgi:DnaK suppressor protein
MARNDALLRLHNTLTGRRDEIRKRLGMDLSDLAAQGEGDVAETSSKSEGIELAGRLAALETQELGRVEKSIARLKKGTYGRCEACDSRIPVARLNSMPTAELCIACQRESERDSSWLQDRQLARYEDEHADDHEHEYQRESVGV